jgi:putative ABC transport system permease protein
MPRWSSQLRHLLRRWFLGAKVESELDEEVAAYVETMVERGVASGLSPGEARRRARLAGADGEAIKEEVRQAWMGAAFEGLLQDLRHAGRVLRRSPGFSAFAIATIALCLGANAAMFSLIDGVLFKATGYPEPERLVRLWERPPGGRQNAISAASYLDWAAQSRSFEALAADAGAAPMSFGAAGRPLPVRVRRVSPGYFGVFGARAALGRTFAPDEDRPGQQRVAVLAHAFWAGTLGGDPALVGGTVLLAGESYTVIGVLPPGPFDRRGTDLWVPLVFPAQVTRDYHYLGAVARLRRGVTVSEAQAEMDGIAGRIAGLHPDIARGWGATVDGYLELMVNPQVRRSLTMLMAAVAVVLFIGCTNLANLLMARATLRTRELAVRTALGASRGRIVRMLLAESLLLAAAGGALGLALGHELLRWIRSLLPASTFAPESEVSMDGRVLLFLAAATLLTALAFGLAPALRASRRDLGGALGEGGRVSAGRRALHLRHLFVAAQVAIAFVLLAGGGLLIRSLQRVLAVDTGVDGEGVVAAGLPLPMDFQPATLSGQELVPYVDRILATVGAQPGVREVAVTTALPLRGWGDGMLLRLPGEDGRRAAGTGLDRTALAGTGFKIVSPGYFRAVGIRPLAGRLLDERDTAGEAAVLVVNQSFVRRNLPDRSPLGQHVLIARILPSRRGLGPETSWEIVGVVPDEKGRGLESPDDVGAYAAFAQEPVVGLGLVVRGSGNPASLVRSIEQALGRVDPVLVLDRPRTVEALRDDAVVSRRVTTWLLGAFAVLALLLACAGIYGVLSFVTAQRTHELGIRAALGASRGALVWMVLVGGALPVLGGLLVGLGGAVAASRWIESLLFGIRPFDPPTLLGAAALLLGVTVTACLIPAWRAARVSPMIALRQD